MAPPFARAGSDRGMYLPRASVVTVKASWGIRFKALLEDAFPGFQGKLEAMLFNTWYLAFMGVVTAFSILGKEGQIVAKRQGSLSATILVAILAHTTTLLFHPFFETCYLLLTLQHTHRRECEDDAASKIS